VCLRVFVVALMFASGTRQKRKQTFHEYERFEEFVFADKR